MQSFSTTSLQVLFGLPLGRGPSNSYSINKCAHLCMEYEVEGPRPRGRPKRTWRLVVEKDCQARKLNKEDAMDRSKWRRSIKDV